jgi:hypothetical protein
MGGPGEPGGGHLSMIVYWKSALDSASMSKAVRLSHAGDDVHPRSHCMGAGAAPKRVRGDRFRDSGRLLVYPRMAHQFLAISS